MELDAIPEVDIDPAGTFKYILIRAEAGGASRTLLRGWACCEYHNDILLRARGEESNKVPGACVRACERVRVLQH
jgi:hypothetical protein